MNPSIGRYLTYGVWDMASFINNLLRKLRWSKTKPVKEYGADTDNECGIDSKEFLDKNVSRFPGTSYRDYLLDTLNKEEKPRHFQGDIFNGWEHDGEPKAWHTRYDSHRRKK